MDKVSPNLDLAKFISNLASGASDFALYSSVRDYIYARIDLLTEVLLSNNIKLLGAVLLSLMTLWVMIQGYMILTGRSQEGLKGFLINIGKNYFIIAVALSFAASAPFTVRSLTDTLNNNVAEIMSKTDKTGGESGNQCLSSGKTHSVVGCKIDKNLAMAQGLLAFMATIDDSGSNNANTGMNISSARFFAGAGAAGPAIVAGTMLIIYRVSMSLFIGFGPLFICTLLFRKTAYLFQKWLYYGIATIFSASLLGVMADICMDLTLDIAKALYVSNLVDTGVSSALSGMLSGGTSSTGLMDMALQQLGLGLIISTLLITVPPMAGTWFNGVMGSINSYSAFGGWNSRSGSTTFTGNPNIDGQMSGAQQVNNSQNFGNKKKLESNKLPSGFSMAYTGATQIPKSSDTIKGTSYAQNALIVQNAARNSESRAVVSSDKLSKTPSKIN